MNSSTGVSYRVTFGPSGAGVTKRGGPSMYVSISQSVETSLNLGVRPARTTLSEVAALDALARDVRVRLVRREEERLPRLEPRVVEQIDAEHADVAGVLLEAAPVCGGGGGGECGLSGGLLRTVRGGARAHRELVGGVRIIFDVAAIRRSRMLSWTFTASVSALSSREYTSCSAGFTCFVRSLSGGAAALARRAAGHARAAVGRRRLRRRRAGRRHGWQRRRHRDRGVAPALCEPLVERRAGGRGRRRCRRLRLISVASRASGRTG